MKNPEIQDRAASETAVIAAAEAGNAEAQFQLAIAALRFGREADFRHWVHQAASQNFPPALFQLGVWRLAQLLAPEDLQDAKNLVQKAADNGLVGAVHAMVAFKTRGVGELPNWLEALTWFQKLLPLNDPRGLMQAGLFLQHQPGNEAHTRALLSHAAAAGDTLAAYHLGCLLIDNPLAEEKGEGLFWLNQSHTAGHILAARELHPYQGQPLTPPTAPLPALDIDAIMTAVSNMNEPLQPFETETALIEPKVQRIKGVLEKWECDYLICRSVPMLQPAGNSEKGTNAEGTHSQAKFWTLQQDIITAYIDRKIALAAEIPVDFCEELTTLHYNPGERDYPHYDSFLPDLPEQAAQIDLKGQRIRTCMVYLNEEFDGGETHFLHPEVKVSCARGEALIIENINEEGDADEQSLHENLAVASGQKWLAEKWVRDKSQSVF